MRLRWIHLPHCGPLRDLGARFGQEDMLYGWSEAEPAKRKGAINFVVGVNGTGKSSLLRAVYRSFRSLSQREPPPLPITLAWDRRIGTDRVTAIFHQETASPERTFFAALRPIPESLRESEWRDLVAGLAAGVPGDEDFQVERGRDAWTGSYLLKHLPRSVIAYTSGSEQLWSDLEQRAYRPDWNDASEVWSSVERPPGWTIEREWAEQVPHRWGQAAQGVPSEEAVRSAQPTLGEPAWVAGMREAKRYEIETREKLANTQQFIGARSADGSRVRPTDLRLAALSFALWQSAIELHGRRADSDQAALRMVCLNDPAASADPARRVLNALDWWQPTHLSLVYRTEGTTLDDIQRDRLGCLLALSERVVSQPLGRNRAVIALGPRGFENLIEDLDSRFPSLFVGTSREAILKRLEHCETGAEAVIRVFSDAKSPESTGAAALEPTLIELFEAFRAWQAAGLLEEVNIVVKRLHRVTVSDGDPDDAIVTFDQLSDGEQMLLGRVALLHLVRGQDGALLLLDEPETHFNDVWKRELIDLIDDIVLKKTFAQVLVSTHTSLALTDVFKSEIVLLRRDRDSGLFYEADEPIETFGAAPEDILRHVFEADEIIGRRAAQILDVVLIVTALEDAAAPLWESGELTAATVAPLWEQARRVPHAFSCAEDLAQFLKGIWSWTKARIGGSGPPRIVDTLTEIERKLGPGHYQFEFRRRILAHRRRDDAARD